MESVSIIKEISVEKGVTYELSALYRLHMRTLFIARFIPSSRGLYDGRNNV